MAIRNLMFMGNFRGQRWLWTVENFKLLEKIFPGRFLIFRSTFMFYYPTLHLLIEREAPS